MKLRITCVIATLAMALASSANSASPPTLNTIFGPVVNTIYGPVKGTLTPGVTEFLGVRYAAPPTGNLRWTPPQPPITGYSVERGGIRRKHLQIETRPHGRKNGISVFNSAKNKSCCTDGPCGARKLPPIRHEQAEECVDMVDGPYRRHNPKFDSNGVSHVEILPVPPSPPSPTP